MYFEIKYIKIIFKTIHLMQLKCAWKFQSYQNKLTCAVTDAIHQLLTVTVNQKIDWIV